MRGPPSPVQTAPLGKAQQRRRVATQATAEGLPIDLRGRAEQKSRTGGRVSVTLGKKAFIAGVADDQV